MELIRNETTGRLTVLLNGTSYYGCQSDLDCPGLAFCRSQREFHWIDGPNSSTTQCICPWHLATHGALCDEPTSYTWGLFTIIVIYGIFASVASLITMRMIWLAGQQQRWKFRCNGSQPAMAHSTASSKKHGSHLTGFTFTVIPLFIANVFTVMYSVQWLIRLVRISDFFIAEENGQSLKRTVLWMAERSSFVISFVAFAMAMNNFSLLWIEVLNSATRVVSNRVSLRKYKMFLAVLYLGTFIGIVAFLVRGQYETIAIVCAPAILVVCVFGGVAWFKVRKVEKLMMKKAQTSVDSDQNSTAAVRNLLGQVRSVAVLVYLFTLCLLICSLAYAVAENRPDQYLQQYFGMLVFFFAGLDELVVSWFMLRTMRRYSTSSAANDGSLSSRPNLRLKGQPGQVPQQLHDQHMAVVAPMIAVCENVPGGSLAMSSLPDRPSMALDGNVQTFYDDHASEAENDQTHTAALATTEIVDRTSGGDVDAEQLITNESVVEHADTKDAPDQAD